MEATDRIAKSAAQFIKDDVVWLCSCCACGSAPTECIASNSLGEGAVVVAVAPVLLLFDSCGCCCLAEDGADSGSLTVGVRCSG